jgi:hypothetical protein
MNNAKTLSKITCSVGAALLFATSAMSSAAVAAGPNSGLIAYYDMNEKSGLTAFNKVSNDKHAQLIGATRTEGKHKRGLQFGRPDTPGDSNAPYAQANGPFDFSTNEMTIAIWAKPYGDDIDTNWQALISSPDCCDYRILLYPGGKPYMNLGQHMDWFVDSVVIPADQWTHIAVTVKGGGAATLYVNGQAVATQSHLVPAVLPSPNSLVFGSGERTSGYFYSMDGKLDEVRVYNRALTAQEVMKVMKSKGGNNDSQ